MGRRIFLFSIFFMTFMQINSLIAAMANIAYNIPDPECTGVFNLCTDSDKERLGRQAIKAIHEQMDDDKDGMIEASESSDFIAEELESKTDVVRHHRFQNADLQITFEDLWNQWKNSAVYNWTTEEVIQWLITHVHEPMYEENFRRNQIDGRMIPRLAANEKHYLSSIMQIRDSRHKRRLIIKATDVVLFGPPKPTHNLVKDMILTSALLVSVAACLYAFLRHRKTQESMNRMVKELETLQQAGGDLIAVTGKMKAMENELKDKVKVDRGLLNSWFIEVQRTKDEADRFRKRRDTTIDLDKQLRLAVQEIEQLRIALRKAEEHARHQSFEAPTELIDLLRRTYFVEETAFEVKRKSAEQAMFLAKEQMNKISKMQKGFFGAVRIAHTGCMDNISELINSAKERLAEVQDEYEEREKRWNRIASLLDREDLISNSSSSTTSTNNNSNLCGAMTNGALNNGVLQTTLGESNNRAKPSSIDSHSLSGALNDSPNASKRNSHISYRGFSITGSMPTSSAAQDTTNLLEASTEQTTHSLPLAVKRRNLVESSLMNSRGSSDRLNPTATIFKSDSSNSFLDNQANTTSMPRPQTGDSLDILASQQVNRPVFDLMSDIPNSNDPLTDDMSDHNSQLLFPASDDRQSVSSSEKTRKSLRATKFFKSFSNLRSRKKPSTT